MPSEPQNVNHKIPKRVRRALTRILGDPNLPPGAVSLVTDILVTGVIPPRLYLLMSYPPSPVTTGCGAVYLRTLLCRYDDNRFYHARPWSTKYVLKALDRLEIYIDAKDL